MRATVIAAACLILLANASAQHEKRARSAMPSGKAVLEAYVSAWNRHDFAALDKLLTRDAVHEDLAQGVHAQGIAQIKDFMREEIQGEPDLNWHLTAVFDASPSVAAEWTWTGTFTGEGPTGQVKAQRISGRGASIVVIENGRIKRFTDYYDLASFFPKRAGSATTSKIDRPLQEAASGPSDEKALLEIGHAWGEAEQKQDAATLNRILDESFLYVGSSGKVYSKSDFVDEILGMKILSYTITGEIARSYGQTGVVTGEWRGRWSADGKEGEDRLHFTAIYTKRDGNWYAVAEQMTGLPSQ
ncbi:MAG TPA: nuclear transport factor 2 family protein [Candidatus Acidoferrales bacterium]|nr:nuclear transport factor 2 family protein [Candidatus Acidoferrales bacterium]